MTKARTLPKRIILSRKGWDSSAGGSPSPIFPDDIMMSLPIPDCRSGICYDNLTFPDGSRVEGTVGEIVEQLSGGRLSRTTEVHLDPDLRPNSIERRTFQPAFGQCGQSQFHLEKTRICKETEGSDADLFLFFGLYRKVFQEAKRWRYDQRASAMHVIFGWLQVGSIYNLPDDPVPDSLRSHPHAIPSFIVSNELARFKKKSNTIYCAREHLTFKPGLGGAGLFGRFDPDRKLTKNEQTKASLWRIPSFFTKLSNMGDQPAPRDGFWEPERKGRGQEFVLNLEDEQPEVSHWLENLFKKVQ
jgi:hypothetical protein